MAETTIDGPLIVGGLMFGGAQGTSSENNPVAGPNISYQGECAPDPRWLLQKDNIQPGVVYSHPNGPYMLCVDASPAASSTTTIAVAATATSGTAMTLATTITSTSNMIGVTPGVPFLPFQTGTARTGLALDFGFAVGSVTAASATVGFNPGTFSNSLFYTGQQLVIGGAGNSAGTAALITTVTAVGTSTITISPVSGITHGAAPIGNANISGIRFGNPVATGAWPYMQGGAAGLLNPQEAVTRCISVTCSSSATTCGAFLVQGYDIYGSSMSEYITATSASSAGSASATSYGKKAFKYVTAVTPQFSSSAGGGAVFSVGTGDTVGFPVRTDRYEHVDIFWNGASVTNSSGWLPAVTTTATSATGDVRGTVQITLSGNSTTSVSSGSTLNGFPGSSSGLRLALYATIPPYNMLAATPANPVPLYGVTQY